MPTTINLARLSDHQLLAGARELARQERILNLQIIDHLTEIAARGLHLRHGYSSLFAYAVKELGFSEGAAHYRIQAKKLCADYPEVKQQLEEGTLTLTGAGQLQSAFERHARRQRQRAREERRRESSGVSAVGGAGGVSGLGAPDGVSGLGGTDGAGAAGKTAVAAAGEEAGATGEGGAAEAGATGAGGAAAATGDAGAPGETGAAGEAGALGAAGAAGEARAAGAPLSESVKRELIEQAQGKSTRQISELIAALDPELVRSRDRLRPLGGDRWELKAVIDRECQRGLEELRHLLSHVNPAMEYGELLQRLVADGLAKYDPARRPVRVRRPKSGSAAPPPADSLVKGDSESARTDGQRSELHPPPGTEHGPHQATPAGGTTDQGTHRAAPAVGTVDSGRHHTASPAGTTDRGPHQAAPAAAIERGRTWAPKSDDPQPSPGRHGSVPQLKPATAAPAEPTNSMSPRPGTPPERSYEPRPSPGQGVAATMAADSETAATHRDRAGLAAVAGTAERSPHHAAAPAGTGERGPDQGASPAGADDRRRHHAASPAETTDRGPHQAAPAAAIERDRTWAPKSDDPQPAASHRTTRQGARATITRTIPAAVKRHIWIRDRGRCTYRDPESGRCCESPHLVQIDHVQPYAMGGSASAENLRLLCSAHNHDRATQQRRTRPARE